MLTYVSAAFINIKLVKIRNKYLLWLVSNNIYLHNSYSITFLGCLIYVYIQKPRMNSNKFQPCVNFLISSSPKPWRDTSLMQYLIFVGGVEWDLCHFGVCSSHVTNTPTAHFDGFQQSWLWCVPRCLPLGKHTQEHISTVTNICILGNECCLSHCLCLTYCSGGKLWDYVLFNWLKH